MTRNGQQRCKQDLGRYLRNMAEALGPLPLWADDKELERLRQLRLYKLARPIQQLSPRLKPDRKEQTDEPLVSLWPGE